MLNKKKEEYNDKLLMLALNRDELDAFISGTGIYQITAPQGMNLPPSYSYSETMTTIYRNYNKINDKRLDLLTEKAFCKIFDIYKSIKIINALQALNYHMILEKSGEAPFKIDCKTILATARKNFVMNKELFKNGEYPFWNEIEYMDKALRDEHGMHIL